MAEAPGLKDRERGRVLKESSPTKRSAERCKFPQRRPRPGRQALFRMDTRWLFLAFSDSVNARRWDCVIFTARKNLISGGDEPVNPLT